MNHGWRSSFFCEQQPKEPMNDTTNEWKQLATDFLNEALRSKKMPGKYLISLIDRYEKLVESDDNQDQSDD
jgi:hypothetical protein